MIKLSAMLIVGLTLGITGIVDAQRTRPAR